MVSRVLLGVILYYVVEVASTSGGTNCYDGRYYIREDPTSCSHFYKCDNGNPVLFPCPGNLYYNPATHNCDWPYNVRCDVNTGQRPGNDNSNNNGQYNGNPNNNGGQYNGNNGYPNNNGGQSSNNNGYPNNNGGQSSNNNGYPGNNDQASDFQNQNDDGNYFYPVQPVDAQDPNIGPSIAEPAGGFEERPRPTIDDLYSGRNSPYQDYLSSNIDIRK